MILDILKIIAIFIVFSSIGWFFLKNIKNEKTSSRFIVLYIVVQAIFICNLTFFIVCFNKVTNNSYCWLYK